MSADSTTKPNLPPVPSAKAPEDPSWWNLGAVPFFVLLMVAAAADLAWPREQGFGIGAGLLTFLIRSFGMYPEGVSIAILTMNLVTPFINDFTKKKTLGGVK